MSQPLDFQPVVPVQSRVAATFAHPRRMARQPIMWRDVRAACPGGGQTAIQGSVASYVNEARRNPDLTLRPLFTDPASLLAQFNVRSLCSSAPAVDMGVTLIQPVSTPVGDTGAPISGTIPIFSQPTADQLIVPTQLPTLLPRGDQEPGAGSGSGAGVFIGDATSGPAETVGGAVGAAAAPAGPAVPTPVMIGLAVLAILFLTR